MATTCPTANGRVPSHFAEREVGALLRQRVPLADLRILPADVLRPEPDLPSFRHRLISSCGSMLRTAEGEDRLSNPAHTTPRKGPPSPVTRRSRRVRLSTLDRGGWRPALISEPRAS